MTIYRHRQLGTAILIPVVVGLIVSVAVLASAPEARRGTGAVVVFIAACIPLFYALTVEVTHREVVAYFGVGLIRKRFLLEDIRGARPVRNPWWYGWGIRLTPRGWMFNISGLDAVELDLDGERRFRIGTDEPDRLVNAIAIARESAG